jgi:lipopolysaccharide/colanic/teichoic acid biosynthesis glycosyltransferase
MSDRVMGTLKREGVDSKLAALPGTDLRTGMPAGPAPSHAQFVRQFGLQRGPEAGRNALSSRPQPLWRTIEWVISLAVLLLASPLLLFIALVIKLDTPGPALFFQLRARKDGRPFKFVKFRTMYADARQRFPELYAYKYDDVDKIAFKVRDDPRRTPLGRLLRRTTIDELPNFWNVLTGDMALVGPRPEILEMLPYYKGDDLLKFKVKPGVTGLAQTYSRGNLMFRETVDLDVKYVRERSLVLDVSILLRTLLMVVASRGAF